MCAFSLPGAAERDELIRKLWQRAVIVLPTGARGVRFRPALTVSRADIDAAIAAVRGALTTVT
jgi:L-lysine 6-transaminase